MGDPSTIDAQLQDNQRQLDQLNSELAKYEVRHVHPPDCDYDVVLPSQMGTETVFILSPL